MGANSERSFLVDVRILCVCIRRLAMAFIHVVFCLPCFFLPLGFEIMSLNVLWVMATRCFAAEREWSCIFRLVLGSAWRRASSIIVRLPG